MPNNFLLKSGSSILTSV